MILQIEDVSYSYRQGKQNVSVLDSVNLDVDEGEMVSVMGKSGSGKTTLLDLAGGILIPDDGLISISGINLTQKSESERTTFRRKHIGMIFQFFNLIPTLTARENILFPLELNGIDRPSRADELLEELEMTHRADAFPSTLSGGERQRIGIARALVHSPDLLLADEPTGNLDYDLSRSVLKTLSRLCREEEVALLMGTHSSECAEWSDRVYDLRAGRLREHT